MAQIILVLVGARAQGRKLDMERLSMIEFLSANPFLVLDAESPASSQLRLQGFGRHSINYASPGQRYVSRRERVASDIARLVSFGLVELSASEGQRVFAVTELGQQSAESLCSVYADAYRLSVATVAPIVMKLSSTKMREQLETWLRVDPVLFDLIDTPNIDELEIEASMLASRDILF
ncbi:hypothetical protein [Salinibacterium sp. PAMC 21357]|uniref:hypothetical protein n=1 Tax=Salinibacterium sp. PAMC 21357 TaxID=1112215 RepID=UPI00058473C1|nr:hypothetical protein [Salinibacterium sp. PAMC 21357]